MSKSIAYAAMKKIDAVGYAPAKAVLECELHGGAVIFGTPFMIPEHRQSGLWCVFRFDDGSMMNIYKRGCAVFDPKVGIVAFDQIPRPPLTSMI